MVWPSHEAQRTFSRKYRGVVETAVPKLASAVHRVRDLSIVLYLLACLLPALTVRNYSGDVLRTFWGYECLLAGWRTLTIVPLLFPAWVANPVFFWALWTGRAGHSVKTFVLALSACLLALFAPLTIWLLPEPWSLGAGYFFWHGAMLLYAWKSRTGGEAVWPAA